MRTVNIAELKAQLSAHIRRVREGEEVLVCERNQPVARIVPCRTRTQSEHERQLIIRGLLTPPRKKKRSSLPEPPGNVPDEVMARVWQEEREGR
jgi:prevent-host-death family protein